jgi:hypothetical protein
MWSEIYLGNDILFTQTVIQSEAKNLNAYTL